MTLGETYQTLRSDFRREGIANPELDARLLIRHVTSFNDADFLSRPDAILTPAQKEHIRALSARRLAGETIGRITGVREFWGLEFTLSPDTLEPRPDTETLVEAALQWVRTHKKTNLRILDLGTGTGCILISLLKECPQAHGLGIDIAPGAVQMARKNAERHGVAARCVFEQGSWAENLSGTFDLIVSNPPYIPAQAIPLLEKEVRTQDPILALDGGVDGLEAYKIILTETKNLLRLDGRIFLEIGFNQENDIARLVENGGLTRRDSYTDLGGIPRVVEISYGDK